MQLNNKVEIISSGLLCDNAECDWSDTTIAMQDMAAYVDTPCPKCGENVLTAEDFAAMQAVIRITQAVEQALDGMTLDEVIAEVGSAYGTTQASVKIGVKNGVPVVGDIDYKLN